MLGMLFTPHEMWLNSLAISDSSLSHFVCYRWVPWCLLVIWHIFRCQESVKVIIDWHVCLLVKGPDW